MTASGLVHSAELLWNRWKIAADAFGKGAPDRDPVEMQALARDMGLCSVAFMLAGYALENILKGLCVAKLAKQSPIVEGDVRLKPLMNTHDLRQLASQAGLAIGGRQSELMDKLHIEVLWGGRYPRPKRDSELFPEIAGNPGAIKMRSFSQQDWDDFVELYNDLYSQLTM